MNEDINNRKKKFSMDGFPSKKPRPEIEDNFCTETSGDGFPAK